MSGWVLTADRKPTADDADENGVVYVTCSGTVAQCPQENVHLHKVWHPKPKAVQPEPYKPPVPGPRLELWFAVSDMEPCGLCVQHCSREAAERTAGKHSGATVAHLREVRDGDPSPEDVADVVARLKAVHNLGFPALHIEVNRCIELLGGKP